MTASTWLSLSPRRYFFGFRGRPGAAPDWKRALAARVHEPQLEPRGRVLHAREFIGTYRFDDTAPVLAAHPDGPRWASPHPCQALGQTLGFLTLQWRASLPSERRAAVSKALCFALQGFVLREGAGSKGAGSTLQEDAGAAIDGVTLGTIELGMLASKYGTDGMLFDSADYLAYVERQAATVAHGAGLWVHRAGRLVVEGKGANKIGGLPHEIELWYFNGFAFEDALNVGFFDDDPPAS